METRWWQDVVRVGDQLRPLGAPTAQRRSTHARHEGHERNHPGQHQLRHSIRRAHNSTRLQWVFQI